MTRSNKTQNYLRNFLALLILLTSVGCSVRVADLTLISTKNIDLEHVSLDVREGQRVRGESCAIAFLGMIPLGIPNLEEAVDDALEKGKGNILVDQVTYHSFIYAIIISESCIEVEGTVLKVPEKPQQQGI